MQDLTNTISIIWSIDDIQMIDPSISDNDARVILHNFDNHHEGSMEAMWQDLEYHIDEFKREVVHA